MKAAWAERGEVRPPERVPSLGVLEAFVPSVEMSCGINLLSRVRHVWLMQSSSGWLVPSACPSPCDALAERRG